MPSVSFSRVKLWRRCHKAHDYKYNQNLTRKRRAIPLVRGTILGEMLNARVSTLKGQNDPFKVLKKYEKEYRSLFLAEKEMFGDVPGDIKRIYEGYERHYANENLEYLASEDFVGLDLVKDIRFIGFIDKRVKDAEGRTFILDHKSHKSIPDADQRFSDLQLAFYVWAWNQTNPSKPVTGLIWDYIRTKAPTLPEVLKNGELSQRANMDTDYYTYLGEIRRLRLDPTPYKETLARLRKMGSDKFYQRVTLPSPSKAMLKNIVDDLKETAIQIHTSKSKDRNMNHLCPSTCEFYQVCQTEVRGLDADFIKKTDYEEREPNEREEAEE